MFLLGVYRRLALSRLMEWRQQQRRPDPVNPGGFPCLLAEEPKTRALRLFLAERPAFKNLSGIRAERAGPRDFSHCHGPRERG